MSSNFAFLYSFCSDNIEYTNDLNDIFYTNKKTANKLIEIAKQEKVDIKEHACF